MSIGSQGEFAYWNPGERRKLRLFFSHRWDLDGPLYTQVIEQLHVNGFDVQDLSLTEAQKLAGPRGGQLSRLQVQRDIAARIYTSDIVIVSSRPGVSRSEWVTWEVQLAGVAYAIPVLFVDHSRDPRRRAAMVRGLERAGATFSVCENTANAIAYHVARLVGQTYRRFRVNEDDALCEYRGPLPDATRRILRQFPYERPNRLQPPR